MAFVAYTPGPPLVSGDLEAICAEVIGSKRKPLTVVCIYRPPSSKVEWFNTFEILLQNIENEEKEFLVLGDLNCDLLPEIKSTHTKKFLDLINLYQLEQLIKEPTRITETTETLIDVIITYNQ